MLGFRPRSLFAQVAFAFNDDDNRAQDKLESLCTNTGNQENDKPIYLNWTEVMSSATLVQSPESPEVVVITRNVIHSAP